MTPTLKPRSISATPLSTLALIATQGWLAIQQRRDVRELVPAQPESVIRNVTKYEAGTPTIYLFETDWASLLDAGCLMFARTDLVGVVFVRYANPERPSFHRGEEMECELG